MMVMMNSIMLMLMIIIIIIIIIITGNWNRSVDITTGYGLEDRGSILVRGKRLFSTPQRPDRFWSTLSLLSNGYRGPFPRRKNRRVVKLTFQLYLVTR
jgi:hypothetical protein